MNNKSIPHRLTGKPIKRVKYYINCIKSYSKSVCVPSDNNDMSH